MNTKRVVVTGAQGIIGRHTLQPLLNAGFEVYAIGRRETREFLPEHVHYQSLDMLEGDIFGYMQRVQPSHCLHLAWYVEHGKFWHAEENNHWLHASIKLLHAFAEQGGKRFVAAGTCAEYDWTQLGDHPCNEYQTPLSDTLPYAKAKNALHKELAAYAAQHDVSYAWGRIFLAHGEGEDSRRLIPTIIQSFLRGETAALSHCRQIRDLMYTGDYGRAFAALLAGRVLGAVNVASGQAHSLREIVEHVRAVIGRGTPVYGAIETRGFEPNVLTADISRLVNEVGYKPDDTLQGLKYSIRYWSEVLGFKQSAKMV